MIPAGPVFHKPKSFITAKNLLYASIFLGVLAVMIRDFTLGIANSGGARALLITIAGYAIIILLIKQMSLCKKWARTVLTVWYILVMLSYPFAFTVGFRISIPEVALLVLQAALQI
ncbi:MAG TPA: hypothetical protein VNV85_06650, partial [Puia sp.]|nr:hypothetical protein [Puia sp.]